MKNEGVDSNKNQKDQKMFKKNQILLIRQINKIAEKYNIQQRSTFTENEEYELAIFNLKELEFIFKDLHTFHSDLKNTDKKTFEKIQKYYNSEKRERKQKEKQLREQLLRKEKEKKKKEQELLRNRKPVRRAMKKYILEKDFDSNDGKDENSVDEFARHLEDN